MKFPMTVDDFWSDVKVECNLWPHRRAGQNAYNVLAYYRPDLSDQICGTENDPFYSTLPLNGLKYNLFGAWIEQNW